MMWRLRSRPTEQSSQPRREVLPEIVNRCCPRDGGRGHLWGALLLPAHHRRV